MKIALTGVLEDGSDRAADVPANPRTPMVVPLGVDLTVELTVVSADGAVQTPDSVVLTVKKKATDTQAAITKSGVVGAETTVFTLAPSDTKDLEPGLYAYDVWATTSGKRDPVIPTSPFILEAAVTRP